MISLSSQSVRALLKYNKNKEIAHNKIDNLISLTYHNPLLQCSTLPLRNPHLQRPWIHGLEFHVKEIIQHEAVFGLASFTYHNNSEIHSCLMSVSNSFIFIDDKYSILYTCHKILICSPIIMSIWVAL